MSIPKVIYVIHASDADLHLRNFKAILGELQTEERITGYEFLGRIDIGSDAIEKVGPKDMVINMLTNSMVDDRPALTEMLHSLKDRVPECKIGEIIIDNIPYEPEFIAFPTDLLPIRSRENMDAVWNELAGNLRDLFPRPEVKPVEEPQPVKKSSLRQFLEKPHLLFWISVPVIFIISAAIASALENTNPVWSSDVISITRFIIIIFIAIGLVYWIMWKFGRQVSVKMNVIHIFLTVGGYMLVRMITIFYSEGDDVLTVIFITILIGQLIFPVNVIYGLSRKRVRKLAG